MVFDMARDGRVLKERTDNLLSVAYVSILNVSSGRFLKCILIPIHKFAVIRRGNGTNVLYCECMMWQCFVYIELRLKMAACHRVLTFVNKRAEHWHFIMHGHNPL